MVTLGGLSIDRRFRGHIFVAGHQSAAAHRLAHVAFQIIGQQFETWSVDVFLVWCSATVLLMSHGKVKLFGIAVMALAVSAEIYSYVVRYFGSGAGGVSPLLKLVLLLPFVWLLLESSKKVPLPQGAKQA